MVRDLLVLSVDPSRVNDPEIAAESERERLLELAKRFSREDLLRAFDLLTRAEADIRGAAQPRYHLEMALLRWIYLRKLVGIEELIAGAGAGGSAPRAPQPPARTPGPQPSGPIRAQQACRRAAAVRRPAPDRCRRARRGRSESPAGSRERAVGARRHPASRRPARARRPQR